MPILQKINGNMTTKAATQKLFQFLCCVIRDFTMSLTPKNVN